MKKEDNKVHPANVNFRYFIWTLVGVMLLVAGVSAYVYVTDTGIDMDNQNINNTADPTDAQQVATKAYVDANGGTKEFFTPASHGSSGTAIAEDALWGGIDIQQSSLTYATFYLPNDYNSIIEAVAVVIMDDRQYDDWDWDLTLSIAADGEVGTNIVNTNTSGTYNFTGHDSIHEIPFTELFTGAEAGDYASLELENRETDSTYDDGVFLGVRIKYQ